MPSPPPPLSLIFIAFSPHCSALCLPFFSLLLTTQPSSLLVTLAFHPTLLFSILSPLLRAYSFPLLTLSSPSTFSTSFFPSSHQAASFLLTLDILLRSPYLILSILLYPINAKPTYLSAYLPTYQPSYIPFKSQSFFPLQSTNPSPYLLHSSLVSLPSLALSSFLLLQSVFQPLSYLSLPFSICHQPSSFSDYCW